MFSMYRVRPDSSVIMHQRQRNQHFVILLYPAHTSYKHKHTTFLIYETYPWDESIETRLDNPPLAIG